MNTVSSNIFPISVWSSTRPGARPEAHIPRTESPSCWSYYWFCSCLSPILSCLAPGNIAPIGHATPHLGFHLVLPTLSLGWICSPWFLRPEIPLYRSVILGTGAVFPPLDPRAKPNFQALRPQLKAATLCLFPGSSVHITVSDVECPSLLKMPLAVFAQGQID